MKKYNRKIKHAELTKQNKIILPVKTEDEKKQDSTQTKTKHDCSKAY